MESLEQAYYYTPNVWLPGWRAAVVLLREQAGLPIVAYIGCFHAPCCCPLRGSAFCLWLWRLS